ncbi:MAG: hypothetical protein AAGC54_01380 [Cyanobacteria bacterium P01_F01_bin.4]
MARQKKQSNRVDELLTDHQSLAGKALDELYTVSDGNRQYDKAPTGSKDSGTLPSRAGMTA